MVCKKLADGVLGLSTDIGTPTGGTDTYPFGTCIKSKNAARNALTKLATAVV